MHGTVDEAISFWGFLHNMIYPQEDRSDGSTTPGSTPSPPHYHLTLYFACFRDREQSHPGASRPALLHSSSFVSFLFRVLSCVVVDHPV
jgi:hypothetical protein